MKSKVALVGGFAAGYVVGARAGRQRYEDLKARTQDFVSSPAVQEKAAALKTFAAQKAPTVGHKTDPGRADDVAEPSAHDASATGPLTPQDAVSQEEAAGRPPAPV